MRIVTFMQCPNFDSALPHEIIERYKKDQAYHREILEASMSGRRLKLAFKELWDQIHWDNVNWRPLWMQRKSEADYNHMIDVIKRESPQLVLTFGKQAKEAICYVNEQFFFNQGEDHRREFHVLTCHHPNARHRTQRDLDDFANKVREFISTFTHKTGG